jgi:phosphoribosyl 1,2-cyclic phosphate phosphodiesterase
MSLTVTILGCGTSGGTPRLGDRWGACDPKNPKNRRLRCSLLVERKNGNDVTTALVDTSPDMRQQLLDAGIAWLDGVLYTHDHADHVHGIDDLRMAAYNGGRLVDVYYDAETGRVLTDRFSYCFEPGPKGEYPAILKGHEIKPGETVKIAGAGGTIEVLPFRQIHGSGCSLGFRFGGLAYSPDVNDLPEESVELLQDLDVWIIDALRYTPHPSHFSLEEALGWIARLKPKRAILTHMHIDLDYATLRRELPKGVEPAYDGMVLTVD